MSFRVFGGCCLFCFSDLFWCFFLDIESFAHLSALQQLES